MHIRTVLSEDCLCPPPRVAVQMKTNALGHIKYSAECLEQCMALLILSIITIGINTDRLGGKWKVKGHERHLIEKQRLQFTDRSAHNQDHTSR